MFGLLPLEVHVTTLIQVSTTGCPVVTIVTDQRSPVLAADGKTTVINLRTTVFMGK